VPASSKTELSSLIDGYCLCAQSEAKSPKTIEMVSGGEILIDADPENGFFRVKVRNVQPAGLTPQLVRGFCYILANGAAMFNLTIKQRMIEPGEGENE